MILCHSKHYLQQLIKIQNLAAQEVARIQLFVNNSLNYAFDTSECLLVPAVTHATGYVDKNGVVQTVTSGWTYSEFHINDPSLKYTGNGWQWYQISSWVFVGDGGQITCNVVSGYTTPHYDGFVPIEVDTPGTLYLNRYGSSQDTIAYYDTIRDTKESNRSLEYLSSYHVSMFGSFTAELEELTAIESVYSAQMGVTGFPVVRNVGDAYVVDKYELEPFCKYRVVGAAHYSTGLFFVYSRDNAILHSVTSASGSSWTDLSIDYIAPPDAAYCYVAKNTSHRSGGVSKYINYRPSSDKIYVDRTWVALGDSLTDAGTLGSDPNYVNYVTNTLGFISVNEGVGGTGFWRGHTGNSAYYQRIAVSSAQSPTIITAMGSFNDLGTEDGVSGTTIVGTYTDSTTSTLAGCMNATIDAIIAKYPDATIGMIAPTPWDNSSRFQGSVHNTYVLRMQEVAQYRNIPFLDLFHESNLRPWEASFRSTYYKTPDDGCHPNSLGHLRIASQVQEFMKKIVYAT